MKKPQWLEKEKLYSILFESERPAGRIFDLTLMTAISLSIIISFIETVPSLARTFQLILEILEYLLTFFFTVEYIARVYCSPKPREYVLSFFGVIDLLSILPPYLSYFLPHARYMILSAAFVPLYPHLPHFQVVQLHQRGLHADALASEEPHEDFRLLLVCADTGHLSGNTDVYGREWSAQYAIHRSGHISLLGHCHDDHCRIW